MFDIFGVGFGDGEDSSLDGDDDGTELGAAETLGEELDELEGPVEG